MGLGFIYRFRARVHNWRFVVPEETIALFLALFVFVMPVSASTRLEDRMLTMRSGVPGAITDYTLSFRYMTPAAVGSVDLLFCDNPIPYEPCVVPTGLDVSGAVLSSQTGETGFSILSKDTNHIVLSRLPNMITTAGMSSYTLSGIHNPTDTSKAFSIRLRTHAAADASGPQIDFGSVRGQVTTSIMLETQVPPMLIFCMAQEVEYNCASTNETYYTDMGELDPSTTLTTQSQMAVGTNATGGFAITVYGSPPTAGTNVVNAATLPTESLPGTDQFGINLVENTAPAIGANPEGDWINALPTSDYSVPSKYKYISGDVVASSPNVSLMKKFTVSYIFNTSPSLRAGVYTTTINFVASGRF